MTDKEFMNGMLLRAVVVAEDARFRHHFKAI